MNEKWEYLVINLLDVKDIQRQQEVLSELGKNGWELTAVTPTTGWDGQGIASHSAAYFKRQMR